MEDLVHRAFAVWDEARERVPDMVVRPSVPVLFFGDVEAYRRSPLRIITVGLNPSLAEFPADDPFRRFRAAETVRSPASAADCGRYLEALCGYFGDQPEHDPYDWFRRAYDDLLAGMGAGFGGGCVNTALHTDLCSPVATSPTWSGLRPDARMALLRPGRDLWHDLVRVLRPQLMLVSVARAHLEKIDFEPAGGWAELHAIERENPYVVKYRHIRLGGGPPAMLVFGAAAQTPFGKVSRGDKRVIGAIAGRLAGA